MATEDSLFGLDVIRDFILSKGGKTTNQALVTHFKSFLNNPKWQKENRQKFKDIVNQLAVVKLDENGEKVLALKKKYRDTSSSQLTCPTSLTKDLPVNRPKAKKAKRAEQFEASIISEPSTPSSEFSLSGNVDLGSPTVAKLDDSPNEPTGFGPSLSDMVSEELSGFGLGSQDSEIKVEETKRPRSATPPEISPEVDEDIPSVSDAPSVSDDPSVSEVASEVITEEPEAPPLAMIEEHMETEEPPCAEPQDINMAEEAAAAAAPPVDDIADDDGSIGADSGVGEGSVMTDARDLDGMSVASSGADSMLSAPAPNKQAAAGEDPSVSVRARAQHLNKIESLSSLNKATGKKQDRSSRVAGAEDEESMSETVTLMDIERKWILDAAETKYDELARALSNTPRLAHYKDFMTGYTALHWAAKHGDKEIIKLLLGSEECINVNAKSNGGYTPLHLASIQGHEDISKLLVQEYKADQNMRDHSGRKPKQYLKHSAATYAQQLPLLIGTHSVGSTTNQTTFHRVGSYNSKIKSMGGTSFGIQGGVAMRKSWASSSTEQMRSMTPSPRASPGRIRRIQSEKDQVMMPPPRDLGIRRQRSRRADSRENLSDSEILQPSFPVRTSSDSNLVIQTETGV